MKLYENLNIMVVSELVVAERNTKWWKTNDCVSDIQKQYKLNPAAQSFIPKSLHDQIAANYAGEPFVQSHHLQSSQQAMYQTVKQLQQTSFSAKPDRKSVV